MKKSKYIFYAIDLLSFISIVSNMFKHYGINQDAFYGYLIALCWFIGFLIMKLINKR